MPHTNEGDRIRDPLEEGEDKANRGRTSGNREESMTESGKDAFGSDSAVRNPDSTSHDEEPTDASDITYIGRLGNTPASSGTTSLSGERKGGNPEPGPGGVEGESGRS